MQCVIPCAGASSRMNYIPKNMLVVAGKPVLQHVIDQWRGKVENFIFIMRREQTYLLQLLPPNSAIVFQDEPKGLAHAIIRAQPFIDDLFVVALADCLTVGMFETEHFNGVGVCADREEIPKNYAVLDKDGKVDTLIEKPEKPIGLCGMGTYFLKRSFFTYVREHPNMVGGSGDLTAILQGMVSGGLPIACNHFKGVYININAPQDILEAERRMSAYTSRPYANYAGNRQDGDNEDDSEGGAKLSAYDVALPNQGKL